MPPSLSMVMSVFACVSHNQHYHCTLSYPTVSPVTTEHPQDQNVTSFEGTIMLSCTATGFPAPTITWFHNNTMEDNTSYTSEMINDYTTRSSFIMSMPATIDSGMYFCRAAISVHDQEVDSSRVTVLVQGQCSSSAHSHCIIMGVNTLYINCVLFDPCITRCSRTAL